MWVDLRSLWESNNLSLSIDPGSITLAGQSATFTTNLAQSTQGSIVLQGQSATFTINEAVTNGAITVAGQSATFTVGLAQSIQGSITFDGQSLQLNNGINLAISSPGTIDLTGQSTTFTLGLAQSTQGSITVQGQAVTPSLNLAISTQGSIGITGQSVTPGLGIAIGTQGSISVNGQTITLALAGSLTLDIDAPGSVTINGQTVTLAAPLQVTAETSGGWEKRRWFYTEYERELKRRIDEEKRRLAAIEAVEEIDEPISREIGKLLQKQEAIDAERSELERLRVLVRQSGRTPSPDLTERVQQAYIRAYLQQNFSALQALDRELRRAMEEEEIAALMILLNED